MERFKVDLGFFLAFFCPLSIPLISEFLDVSGATSSLDENLEGGSFSTNLILNFAKVFNSFIFLEEIPEKKNVICVQVTIWKFIGEKLFSIYLCLYIFFYAIVKPFFFFLFYFFKVEEQIDPNFKF